VCVVSEFLNIFIFLFLPFSLIPCLSQSFSILSLSLYLFSYHSLSFSRFLCLSASVYSSSTFIFISVFVHFELTVMFACEARAAPNTWPSIQALD
jgi:hypothetical protein